MKKKQKISPEKGSSPKPSVQFDSSAMNSSPSADNFILNPPDLIGDQKYHPKRVVTPDWIKEEHKEIQSDTKSEPLDREKIADIHFELEVLERRIEFCIDTKHGHPALCVKVREEEGISDITRKEKKLRANYQFIPPVNIIPAFWEPRVYDKPENKLSKEDTKTLRDKITQTSTAKGHSQMVTRMHSWNTEGSTPNPFFSYADQDIYGDIDDYCMYEDFYHPSPHKKVYKKKPATPKKTSTSTQPVPTDAFGNPIKRKRGRPRKYPRPEDLISISLASYATDDSENNTDWDH